MGEFFSYDNSLWRFLGKLLDVLVLNLLWALCSLPVVTIGASTTALHYVTIKMATDRDSHVVQSFFKAFRDNLKQSLVIGLIMVAAGGILAVDLWFFLNPSYMEGSLRLVLLYLSTVFLILYLALWTYIFPVQCRFYNPVRKTFTLAAYMMIRHLPKTLLMLCLDGLYIYLMLTKATWLFFWGYGGIAFLNSFILARVLSVYEAPKEKESESLFQD